MRLPAYPRYKPSGVEWLGDVPEHWSPFRLGFGTNLLVPMRDKPEDLTGDIPWIRIEDFNGRDITCSKSSQGVSLETARKMNLKIFPAGTVLCSCSCSMGATAIARVPLVSNQTFIGIVPGKKLISEFLFYALAVAKNYLDSMATGAIQQYLSRSDFSQLRLTLPTVTEQLAIVKFLDQEIDQIDQLIEKKQELIERLNEKHRALISRTVTRGLPPAAGLSPRLGFKPSGIEWLGEVPTSWEIIKLAHGFSVIGSGTTPKSDSEEFYGGSVPWVTTSELRESVITTTSEKVTSAALAACSTLKLYPAGTLLFAMYGATIGRLGILGIPATLNQACCAFSSPKLFDTKFVYYWLWMRRPELIAMSSGGGQPNLSQDDLRQVRIPAPPLPEQAAIVAYLDRETAKYGTLIMNIESAIERLQEYRSALITAAVTGKIDVQKAAA